MIPEHDKTWCVETLAKRGVYAHSYAWFIHAPWAHPAWSRYMLALYNLTDPVDKAVVRHLKGATHEMLLFALHPEYTPKRGVPVEKMNVQYLEPPNMGYQFIADSDEAARERIQGYVDKIDKGELSPDTDFRYMWNDLFKDGHSLVRSWITGA